MTAEKEERGTLGARVAEKTDLKALVEVLRQRTPELQRSIEQSIQSAIQASTTSQLLTLHLRSPEGRTLSTLTPSPAPDYVMRLVACLRNNPPPRGRLSLGIEDTIEQATRKSIVGFYDSPETIDALSKQLVQLLAESQALQSLLKQELASQMQWLCQEIQETVSITGKRIVADRALDAISDAVSHALHTTGGTLLVGMLAKVLAYPTVKAAIIKGLLTALGSAAFQKVLLLAMKKAGIGLIVHVILAKFVAGGAAIPLGWVVAPIIAAILVYEYVKLPEKLADAVAPKVAARLAEQAPELNQRVAVMFVQESVNELSHFLEGKMQSLREMLLEEVEQSGSRGRDARTLHSALFDELFGT